MRAWIELTLENGEKADVFYEHIVYQYDIGYINGDGKTVIVFDNGRTITVIEERAIVKAKIIDALEDVV